MIRVGVLLVVGPTVVAALLFAALVAAVMLPELGPTDTVYAKGYSEGKFRNLRVGMTHVEVEAVMGPPLRKIKITERPEYEEWWYSESPSSDDFWRRHLRFHKGKVSEVVCDFWVD